MANPFILLILSTPSNTTNTNSIDSNIIKNDLFFLSKKEYATAHPYKLCEWKRIISITSWTFEELYMLTDCLPYLRNFIFEMTHINFNDNDFLFEVCFDDQPSHLDLLWRNVIFEKYPKILNVSNKNMTDIYMNAILDNDVDTLHFIFKCTNYIKGDYAEGEYIEGGSDFANYISFSDYCKYYDDDVFYKLESLLQKEDSIILNRNSLIIHPLLFAALCTDVDSFFSYVKHHDIAVGYTVIDYCPVYTYCSYKKGYYSKSYYESPEESFNGYYEEVYVVATAVLRVHDIQEFIVMI